MINGKRAEVQIRERSSTIGSSVLPVTPQGMRRCRRALSATVTVGYATGVTGLEHRSYVRVAKRENR
jgi:hypothetical protein